MLLLMQLYLRIVSGMANMKTLIRLLLQSDLGLHCLHMPFFVSNFSVPNFKTYTVHWAVIPLSIPYIRYNT